MAGEGKGQGLEALMRAACGQGEGLTAKEMAAVLREVTALHPPPPMEVVINDATCEMSVQVPAHAKIEAWLTRFRDAVVDLSTERIVAKRQKG